MLSVCYRVGWIAPLLCLGPPPTHIGGLSYWLFSTQLAVFFFELLFPPPENPIPVGSLGGWADDRVGPGPNTQGKIRGMGRLGVGLKAT